MTYPFHSIPRRLLERLSRHRVIRRRLPARFGRARIFVTPDAALTYLKPGESAFDAELLSVADHFVRPGDRVWDIGANVGVFALAAAARASSDGIVYAVEADPFLVSLLFRSATDRRNAALRLRVLCAAVSDRDGLAEFRIALRGRAANALTDAAASSQAGGWRTVQPVVTVTLDRLRDEWPAPNLVKIDVEGAELTVLRGGERLLQRDRPLIYCEVSDAASEAVTQILLAADYHLYDPHHAEGVRRMNRCAWNTLAVPTERAKRYQLDPAIRPEDMLRTRR